MTNETFIFERYGFDPQSGVLQLHYAYDGGASFIEIITFPAPIPYYNAEAADRLFRLLFLFAGASYYKAYAPKRLVCKAFKLDDATAAWMGRVYCHGLAEFAYQNKLKLDLRFEATDAQPAEAMALPLPERILVPVGGGKDSIVTLEALRDMDVTLFALGGAAGPAQPIADTIKVSGLPHIYVSRQLSPVILELNKQGAYNGHVPITAILSAIALCCAVLYGYKAVVMSNEHSASVPNFDDVNHQYSKSFEFETELAGYVKAFVSPDLDYFSFLRPLSEIAIARRFAGLPQYHDVFRSCNTAFKQDEAARGKKWCCHCPKCRFVFLALAPFMNKARLSEIFGIDMLNDASQIEGFAELTGASAFKPFECVGEIAESAAALKKVATMPEWQDDVVVKTLAGKVSAPDFDTLFGLASDHAVPAAYVEHLDEG